MMDLISHHPGAPEETSTSQASRVSLLVPFPALIALRSLSLLAVSPPSCVQFDLHMYPNFWRSQPLCLASKLFSLQQPDAQPGSPESPSPYDCCSAFLDGPFPYPFARVRPPFSWSSLANKIVYACLHVFIHSPHTSIPHTPKIHRYMHITNTLKSGRAPREKPTSSQQCGCCYDRIMHRA